MMMMVMMMMMMYCVRVHLEVLDKYKSAITKRREAEAELNEQLQNQVAADMKVKHRECKETEDQLKLVETRLGNLIVSSSVTAAGLSQPVVVAMPTAVTWVGRSEALMHLSFALCVFRLTLLSRPNKLGLKCPSVCTYVRMDGHLWSSIHRKFLRFQ